MPRERLAARENISPHANAERSQFKVPRRAEIHSRKPGDSSGIGRLTSAKPGRGFDAGIRESSNAGSKRYLRHHRLRSWIAVASLLRPHRFSIDRGSSQICSHDDLEHIQMSRIHFCAERCLAMRHLRSTEPCWSLEWTRNVSLEQVALRIHHETVDIYG